MSDATQAGTRESVEERSIIDQAKHDPKAFAPLYEHYLDSVYRYCYRRLGSREGSMPTQVS